MDIGARVHVMESGHISRPTIRTPRSGQDDIKASDRSSASPMEPGRPQLIPRDDFAIKHSLFSKPTDVCIACADEQLDAGTLAGRSRFMHELVVKCYPTVLHSLPWPPALMHARFVFIFATTTIRHKSESNTVPVSRFA
nr:hypothetical protein CFP56_50492 [Quercus suber]POF20077.1 hypothetical protein CFP56_52326 [Quercus suber]